MPPLTDPPPGETPPDAIATAPGFADADMPERGRILLVGGDEITRAAVRLVAESERLELFVYTTVSSLAATMPEGPACVVLDTPLLPVGPTPIDQLRAAGVETTAILVTNPTTVRAAVRAMEAGAAAVLEKPCSAGDLRERLKLAVRRDAGRLSRDARLQDASTRLGRLTLKERQTLSLILKGKTNREIAGDLGLSVRAVEDRRSRTIRRAGADNILDLVRLVHVAGWSLAD